MNDLITSNGKEKLLDSKNIAVVTKTSPFNNSNTRFQVREGQNLTEIINSVFPDPIKKSCLFTVSIDGKMIDPNLYEVIKPNRGQLVNIGLIPRGGGGSKGVITAIITIALIVAAPYLAPVALGAIGVSASSVAFAGITYGQLFAAAFIGLGALAINALAPPPKAPEIPTFGNEQESPTRFIEGARNSINPFGVIPVCLGVNRMFPLQAAKPYTEVYQGDNFVRQLFTFGYGEELVVTDYKIGETSIEDFNDMEIVERLEGNLDEATELFPNDVFQEDFNILLSEPDGFTTRNTQADTDEAIVDFTFNGLVKYNSAGKKTERQVELELQYADITSSPLVWESGASYSTIPGKVLNFQTPFLYNSTSLGDINYSETLDVVLIDRYTGDIKSKRFTYNNGNVTVKYDSRFIRLASLRLKNDNGVVSVVSFTDDRDSALYGEEFQDSGDFVPTNTGTQQITISSGELKALFTVTGAQNEPLRISRRLVFPARGQYSIRAKRVTADSTSDQIVDNVFLTSIKSVTNESPVTFEGINGLAVRIKATDQLSGALDQLNAIVGNVIPDYDNTVSPTTWTNRLTSNPASIYRYVLQGLPNSRALDDDRINITDLEAWWEYCDEKGYEYNKVIDYETSVEEILRDVAAAGMASPAIVDGKRTIVIDKEKEDIVQIVTPRNSWGYEGQIIYPAIPHAFRVQFRNRFKGYSQDERIVYNDGYTAANATLFETLELQACTDPDLAFTLARRYLAQIRLRPEVHSFNMDIENLVAKRGDRIKLVNDVALVGVGYGRIKSVTMSGGSPNLVTGVELDDVVSIPNGNPFYMRIRLSDGSQIYKELITSIGTFNSFNFQTPFDDAIPEVDDLCYVVETGKELDLIITRIEPDSDLNAKITAIDYAPAIFDADSEIIPAFDSNITIPLEFIRPVAPVLVDEKSDETVMQLNSDGSFLTRAVFTLDNQNEGDVTVDVKFRESGTDYFRPASVLQSNPEQVIITGLDDGTNYDIHIRYQRLNSSILSLPLQINNYTFIGESGVPDDVSAFRISIVDNSALLKWAQNDDIDLSHYKIKFSKVFSGADWDTAQVLEDNIYGNSLTVPFQAGTYLIKAVDLSGNESANATTIITAEQGTNRNVVKLFSEHSTSPVFDGSKTNISVVSNALRLTDTDFEGTYEFSESIDLTDVFTCYITSKVVSGGADISGGGNNDVFSFTDVFAVSDIFGISSSGWAVELQYRQTNDDPLGSPVTWSDWAEFKVGTYTFRAMEFRLKLYSYEDNISPDVTELEVTIDMPDRIERGDDVTVPVAGKTITFDEDFKEIPAVAITLQDGETDDRIEFTSKTVSGFTFKVYNGTTAGYVERTFDYIASGYGRV